MADVTYYLALPFTAADAGVAPGEAVECKSASAAMRRLTYSPKLTNSNKGF
jgi:hypothetical protein